MKTLYDLLGALPEDDADDVRAAFRKAAKAVHPDTNPDDPDAALRLRQVMRAHAILSDPQQRAAYDRLLALTVQQARPKPKATVSGAIRKLAFDAIAVASLSTMSIGGYLLFEQLSKAAPPPRQVAEVAALAPTEAAAAPAPQLAAAVRDKPPDKPDAVAAVRDDPLDKPEVAAARDETPDKAETVAAAPDEAPDKVDGTAATREVLADKSEVASATNETIPPDADAPAANTASAEAAADMASAPATVVANAAPQAAAQDTGSHDPKAIDATTSDARAPDARAPDDTANDTKADDAKAVDANILDARVHETRPHDARSYWEHGTTAYRGGDLSRAIADFDQAIRLDRNFAEAYVDRGIALYRLHEVDRAFADIARVKRIKGLDQARAAMPATSRPSPSRGRN